MKRDTSPLRASFTFHIDSPCLNKRKTHADKTVSSPFCISHYLINTTRPGVLLAILESNRTAGICRSTSIYGSGILTGSQRNVNVRVQTENAAFQRLLAPWDRCRCRQLRSRLPSSSRSLYDSFHECQITVLSTWFVPFWCFFSVEVLNTVK